MRITHDYYKKYFPGLRRALSLYPHRNWHTRFPPRATPIYPAREDAQKDRVFADTLPSSRR
jgi:hypothetical protein